MTVFLFILELIILVPSYLVLCKAIQRRRTGIIALGGLLLRAKWKLHYIPGH